MREKRLIGGLSTGAEENRNHLPVRKELILKIGIEVHREMPHLFNHIDGRINESNACLTEYPRREHIERIKKYRQKTFSWFVAAPIVEITEPDSAGHGPIEFPQFLRKNIRIGEFHSCST
ncbi:MAG: hypothetical protein ACLQFI_20855 [Methylocella sp.]